ncbi:hypothetical protein JVU11DRAFT_12151 [Chiua virens]|nr:hypothetical protein JVU11DRAFT_12151 [Chiua virens]
MPMRLYPDDREPEPVQLTLSEFVREASGYYNAIGNHNRDDELEFLKFVLAGRRGLQLNDQRSITVNAIQGQPDIDRVTATHDYDSLIGTTQTLPYLVALTVWPVPSFRDTLKSNNHVTSIAYNQANVAVRVPMHSIPNLALGKVANRSVIRVFFPRMYRAFDSNKISRPDIELIYGRCLRPIIRRLIPNQATHWPPTYNAAVETSRDRAGRFHIGSLDIPAHLLPEFSAAYLESIQTLRPYFQDAYFGHELRGWKGATVHNLDPDADEDQPDEDQPDEAEGDFNAIHERVNALNDLTRVLDMDAINQDQWLIDIGIEFGVPDQVVTWRSLGHESLVHYLIPELEHPARALGRSKKYYIDNQMHLKDLAGFRWTPGSHSDTIHYVQAYTTEKAISYQLHQGIFSLRKPSELLTHRVRTKLIKDLQEQSQIIYTCTGDDDNEDSVPQEGCARLEVRVLLSQADQILRRFPRNLLNLTMVQIPAPHWWYFKWLRLAGAYTIIQNIHSTAAKDRSSENNLALGAMAIWIINGAHRTPVYRMLGLAKEACPEILLNGDEDPEDPDALTTPLMYDAGVYFLCDIISDARTHSYRIPFSKTFTQQFITQAYEVGTINELQHLLDAGEIPRGHQHQQPGGQVERTKNRSSNHTYNIGQMRPADRLLPAIGRRLDGLPLPEVEQPHGADVDYFHQHGGGNPEGLSGVIRVDYISNVVASQTRQSRFLRQTSRPSPTTSIPSTMSNTFDIFTAPVDTPEEALTRREFEDALEALRAQALAMPEDDEELEEDRVIWSVEWPKRVDRLTAISVTETARAMRLQVSQTDLTMLHSTHETCERWVREQEAKKQAEREREAEEARQRDEQTRQEIEAREHQEQEARQREEQTRQEIEARERQEQEEREKEEKEIRDREEQEKRARDEKETQEREETGACEQPTEPTVRGEGELRDDNAMEVSEPEVPENEGTLAPVRQSKPKTTVTVEIPVNRYKRKRAPVIDSETGDDDDDDDDVERVGPDRCDRCISRRQASCISQAGHVACTFCSGRRQGCSLVTAVKATDGAGTKGKGQAKSFTQSPAKRTSSSADRITTSPDTNVHSSDEESRETFPPHVAIMRSEVDRWRLEVRAARANHETAVSEARLAEMKVLQSQRHLDAVEAAARRAQKAYDAMLEETSYPSMFS